MNHFTDRLFAAIEEQGSPVCVGIDPHIDRIPRAFLEPALASYGNDEDGLVEVVASFSVEILNLIHDAGIRVVKPQVAFFEALGPNGLECYESICREAHAREMVIIADVKRGDIGSTSAAYSRAWLGGSEFYNHRTRAITCDAITVNPYLGSDGIKPFIEDAEPNGRGIFVLLRTSNPSSSEIQEQVLQDGRMVYEKVADLIHEWGEAHCGQSGMSLVGAVVGATQEEAARALRERMPKTIFLVPGYGAQGAGADALKPFFNNKGEGAIVNSSRGVIHAYGDSNFEGDWRMAIRNAAKEFIKDVGSVLLS